MFANAPACKRRTCGVQKDKIMREKIDDILSKCICMAMSPYDAVNQILSLLDGNTEVVSASHASKSDVLHAVRKWNADHPSDAISGEDVAGALGKRIDEKELITLLHDIADDGIVTGRLSEKNYNRIGKVLSMVSS